MRIFTANEAAQARGMSPHSETERLEITAAQSAEEIHSWLEPRGTSWRIAVLAGSGWTGCVAGALAERLSGYGYEVRLFNGYPEAPLPPILEYLSESHLGKTLLIDGLFGAENESCAGSPAEKLLTALSAITIPTISLGMPSGLDPDTGLGEPAIRADLTIAIGCLMQGMLRGNGPLLCGEIRWIPAGLPKSAMGEGLGGAFHLREAAALLPPRRQDSHKYSHGRILIMAGSERYNGAPFLASDGALRSGAGLVRLLLPSKARKRPGPASLIVEELENASCFNAEHLKRIEEAASTADSILYGPGISPDAAPEILSLLLNQKKPLILDADALNILAAHPELRRERKCPLILTPHAGELHRLIQAFIPESETLPVPEQARRLAECFQAIIVMKGHPTRVFNGTSGQETLILSGGPSLATAGTGDVLAGVITAFAAQMPPEEASCLGAFIHGLAGDLYPFSPRSMTADDLPGLIPSAFRRICIW